MKFKFILGVSIGLLMMLFHSITLGSSGDLGLNEVSLILQALELLPSTVQSPLIILMGITTVLSWFVDPFVKDETLAKLPKPLLRALDVLSGRFFESKRFYK